MAEDVLSGTFREAGSAQGTWAILVAAGAGDRLGADRPKAFAALAGRPLVAESLERLDASDWIDAIVVAAPPGWEEPVILLAEELVASKVTSVVAGGETRAESVRNALAEVGDEALVVLVHDAARPLLDDAVLERVLGRLDGTVDGVVPGVTVQDTVKRVSGGVVAETVDRDGLVAVQTPQAFVAERLRAAFSGDLAGATDCASLVERRGGRVAVVDGDPRLAKVTTVADLEHVAGLLDPHEPSP
jgi:2-C-methyl-D-erythritol 4-phosphate cytidylyltransferase